MSKIKLVTDASCFLPLEIIEKEDIGLLESRILIDGEPYREQTELNQKEFINSLSFLDPYPTTSQAPTNDALEIFEKAIDDDYDRILYLALTSNVSSVANSARLAIYKIKRKIDVTIYQTDLATSAQGILVYRAIQMRNKGKSVKEIIDKIEQLKCQTYTLGVSTNFDSLFRSGKVKKGAAISVLASVLHMKPIAEVNTKDGVIGVGAGIGFKNALGKMVKHIKENTSQEIEYDLIMSDALNKPLMKKYEKEIKKVRKIRKTFYWSITGVVALSTGKGCTMATLSPVDEFD